jgi:DNA-binding winged helix-turn-helix (wHTH) protein
MMLPFQSRYANEENVRQIVRRLRSALKKVGISDLVESIPRRGYYVAWSVAVSAKLMTD